MSELTLVIPTWGIWIFSALLSIQIVVTGTSVYVRLLARRLQRQQDALCPPHLQESTLAAIEAAIIEETGNGEIAAYTAEYLQGLRIKWRNSEIIVRQTLTELMRDNMLTGAGYKFLEDRTDEFVVAVLAHAAAAIRRAQ